MCECFKDVLDVQSLQRKLNLKIESMFSIFTFFI